MNMMWSLAITSHHKGCDTITSNLDTIGSLLTCTLLLIFYNDSSNVLYRFG